MLASGCLSGRHGERCAGKFPCLPCPALRGPPAFPVAAQLSLHSSSPLLVDHQKHLSGPRRAGGSHGPEGATDGGTIDRGKQQLELQASCCPCPRAAQTWAARPPDPEPAQEDSARLPLAGKSRTCRRTHANLVGPASRWSRRRASEPASPQPLSPRPGCQIPSFLPSRPPPSTKRRERSIERAKVLSSPSSTYRS